MKSILKTSTLLLAVFVQLSFNFAGSKTVEAVFWVNHDCGKCKQRIENAADIKGVISASYNEDSEMLTVVFKPKKVTLEEIHQAIANAGYDTSMIKASDEAYGKLPGCCQYDRKN